MLKDNEYKILEYVENERKQGQRNKLYIFKSYANKKGISYKTVRNLYYATIKKMTDDEYTTYNFNKACHNINPRIKFNEKDNILVENVLEMYRKGTNLRKSCKIVAKGDLTLALRLQNKICHKQLHKKENIFRRKIIAQSTTPNKLNDNAKLIQMKPKTTMLTDQDITNLFLGLVKLVKRTTEEKIKSQNKLVVDKSNLLLNEKMRELNWSNSQLAMLKNENCILKRNVSMLQDELNSDREANEKLNELKKILAKFGTLENNLHSQKEI